MNIQDVANAQIIVRVVPEGGDSPKPAQTVRDAQSKQDDRKAGKTAQPIKAGRGDKYETMTFEDSSALYDVIDIRRRGGGHILPRYQVVRKLTLEGDRLVDKMVDVVLATERKSLRIYRKEQ